MKKLAISLMLMVTGYVVLAQNEYRTPMKNNADSKIEIQVGSETVRIIGHDKDEIIITTDFVGEFVDSPKEKNKQKSPDRAAGLKPLSMDAADNTGIGLVVEKGDNFFSVLKVSENAMDKTYTFHVPNKANLTVNDIHANIETTYSIENYKGEIEMMALNSQITMKNISGPVVANATNGNVEIIFSKLTLEKPNSILSVNGFVDVSLPKDVAADLQLHTVNGEAYTDWEIEVDKDASVAMPVIADMNMFNIEGTINGGGIPITIQSVNGDIYLRKLK